MIETVNTKALLERIEELEKELNKNTSLNRKNNTQWDNMNELDWIISGGGWFENDTPSVINREKRKKPHKVKEGLTQEEVDFLKSTLNKQLEQLTQDLVFYKECKEAYRSNPVLKALINAEDQKESNEMYFKLYKRDKALIKKLSEIQRKLKRGLNPRTKDHRLTNN